MTLTPLAFFDLLENEGANWLPTVDRAGDWAYQRTVDFAEKSGLLRITHGEEGNHLPAATVRARQVAGVGLQGQVQFGAGERTATWDLPQRTGEEVSGAVLALAQGWKVEIAAVFAAAVEKAV